MTIRTLPELRSATARAPGEFDLSPQAVANWNAALRPTMAADNQPVISILDPIGEDFFGNGFTAKRMSAALRSIGEQDVQVHINSPGGLIDEGTAIYNMLRMHKGKVSVKIIGMAASIASIIAMAGDTIEIAKAGFVFVHNGEGVAVGNRHVMDEMFAALQEFDAAMTQVYADRTGLAAKDIEKLMDGKNNGGTLMGSTMALDKGFADALLQGDAVKEDAKAQRIAPAAAAHRMNAALARAGMTRSERSELIRAFKSGTQTAAEDATRTAGVDDDLTAALARIDIPLNAKP